eukprot:TRINITY_DN43852_c0_g1_i1.p1 TRINITY_DN43852_c0_g1~~TRINITY_DN43852_c0_g1_i1.p1  ORF type:complete len:374 (-),score=71.84 TRINITY_DN43852_c0_g1_i1:291-1328(-)
MVLNKKKVQDGRAKAAPKSRTPTKAVKKDRNLTSAQCAEKKINIDQDLAKIDKAEDDKEQHDMLGVIIAELVRCPEKLKKCKRYVLSDFFLPKGADVVDKGTDITETAKWYWKVPKGVYYEILPEILKMTEANLKHHEREKRGSVLKLVQARFAIESSAANTIFNKKLLSNLFVERAKLIDMELSITNGVIDTSKTTWYKLQPPLQHGVDPGTHRFTHVVLMGKWKVPLPKAYNVTGEWTIHDQWSLQFCHAKVTEVGEDDGGHAHKIPPVVFWGFYAKHEEVQNWFETVCAAGQPEVEPHPTPPPPQSSSSSSSAAPSKPKLSISPSKLTSLLATTLRADAVKK